MDQNENHPPTPKKPSKKLQLDLSEAIAQGFDDDDDEIIELKDEITAPSQEKETLVDSAAHSDEHDAPSDLPAVEKIIDLDALDDHGGELQDVASAAQELTFEEEDEDGGSRTIFEQEDEIGEKISIFEEEPVRDTDPRDDEVEEVNAFDDIISRDTNELITLPEISEELEPEDEEEEEEEEEYLELIDVEEESETEPEEIEEEIIQFNDPDAEDVELKDFIDDSLDEEIRISDDFEDDLAGTLGVEAGADINLGSQTSVEDEEDEFDFNMDAREISEKIDRLDTIFFDDDDTDEEAEYEESEAFDSEVNETLESDYGDDSDETEDVDVGGRESSDGPLTVSGLAVPDADHDQLEKTIERIIEQNFSGKIEFMITQIIEKAVSKEIKRLKKILLEDDVDEDF